METRPKTIQTVSKILLKIAMSVALLSSSVAKGVEFSPSHVRISSAGDKFDGVTQVAVVVDSTAPEIFRSHHTEFAFGAISATGDSEMFASYGPVWRLPLSESDLFVDLGVSATLVTGTRFGGRDLGGHFHFTSSVTVGKRLGQSRYIALRIQHLSNAGLNSANPGMDMIGLDFSIKFSD